MKKIELDKPITYRGIIRMTVVTTIIGTIATAVYVITVLDYWSDIGDKIINMKNKIFKRKISKKTESA